MGRLSLHTFWLWLLLACLAVPSTLPAEDERPNYEELKLESIFPAGGQIGHTVQIELRTLSSGVYGAKQLLIDGPPGITVKEVRQEPRTILATLEIAREAVPGRRGIRVLGERVGLSNQIFFSVGTLPEVVEHATEEPQVVITPCVVNGIVNPDADVDRYQFSARAGQRLVAFAAAQALDSHGQYKNYGYVDLNLQVTDPRGQIIAEAQDSIGLDPLVEFQATLDGVYTVTVDHVLYRGFPQAVYRLTLGEVPVATAAFPPGGRRGTTTSVSLSGPLVPPETIVPLGLTETDDFPWGYLSHPASNGDVQVPFVTGTLPELLEVEPNGETAQATAISLSMTANGRFEQAGDVDWYKLTLAAPGTIEVSTLAMRFLRSPVDTTLEVYDSTGKKLAENDDGFPIDYISPHDFQPPDSRLKFQAPAVGDYFIKVYDQSGASGARAVYRLTVQPAEPDFELLMYPDGVPVWGPGSTAALAVMILRQNGLTSDVELRVEGLPEGWTGSRSVVLTQTPERPASSFYNYFGTRSFLTITAPSTAKPTDLTEFRVIGRTTHNGRTIERVARPLSLYYSSDIGFFRMTNIARAAVANARKPWLSTAITEITGTVGETLEVPVQIHEAVDQASIVLVPNLATAGVACAYNAPGPVAIQNGIARVPVKITPETPPGEFYFTISRSWGSDIRVGMPGPCTPLIKLVVKPKPQ